MSIMHLKGQEAFFIGFRAIGNCFIVSDGKLVLVDGAEGETPETELNGFLEALHHIIEARRYDLEKAQVVTPLFRFMVKTSNVPADDASGISKALAEYDEKCREAITEAEILIEDILDLMTQYNVPIRSRQGDGGDKVGTAADQAQNEMSSLLAKLRSSK